MDFKWTSTKCCISPPPRLCLGAQRHPFSVIPDFISPSLPFTQVGFTLQVTRSCNKVHLPSVVNTAHIQVAIKCIHHLPLKLDLHTFYWSDFVFKPTKPTVMRLQALKVSELFTSFIKIK